MTMPLNVRIFNKNTFQSDWKEGQLIKFYPIGQIPLDAKFCEIDEYESIKILFESGHHDDRLYFDHFIEDVQKTLKPGDSEVVITTDHSSSMPSPAYYSLRIEGPSGMWESLYLINSKHMDLAYIHSLRLYLEQRVNGITYDLIRRRSGMWVPEVGTGQYWFNVYRND